MTHVNITRAFLILGSLALAFAPQRSALAASSALATQSNPMFLVVDAREASRGLLRTHVSIPVTPGATTLVYAKWIPGEHGPTGPLGDLAALTVKANDHSLTWSRDPVDLYAFHVDVPAGVSSLDVDFDVLMNKSDEPMASGKVAVVHWERALLYQADVDVHDVFVKASIELPSDWDYGTALPNPTRTADRVDFGEVNLETLVDSPLDCGRYAKHVVLWQGGDAQAVLDAFADGPQDLEFPDSIIKPYRSLPTQTLLLYGARHWNVYHFLLTLSDAIGEEGIEHHQSSDNRANHDFMTNADWQTASGDLLSHEFSHSWNGKYRRPADLTTPNYQVPMKTDLLWVYEGMNQYLGDLLSFRSGIRDPKKYPEYLAALYAHYDNEPGRNSEPLIDTAVAAPYLYLVNADYNNIRRSTGDFYGEGELVWLDVDTIIREQSHGTKSLESFLQLFAGPPNTGPMVVTYTREQVEDLLHDVQPYDWHAFFQHYVYSITERPPSDELARSGWRLIYTSTLNEFEKAAESVANSTDVWYSLGFTLKKDDVIEDVREGSPAWKAGLTPGAKVLAINGQAYDDDVLKYALTAAQHSAAPIAVLVSKNDWYATHPVDYHSGPRYPHLERIKDVPDMLGAIMTPAR